MNRNILSAILLASSLSLALSHGMARAQNAAKVDAKAAANSNVEVLTRGPIHEAFAEQVQLNAVAGIKVEPEPPPLIDEIPPDVRPSGDYVQWIPGYWGWDVAAKEHLWVSGTYRNAPPGMRWIPGYWNKVDGGYQWMSGFWLKGNVAQLQYHAAPPKSVERGPTSNAPAEGHFWVTGSFVPNNGKYAWQPGYWAPYQQNNVWVSAHNVQTAGGYVHVPGYWDHRLDQRGTLFAPVRLNTVANAQGAVRFTPGTVIPATALQYHLFAQANSNAYLFGNYYEDEYADLGIRPWYSRELVKGVHDPLFGYYHWYYGQSGANYLDIMTKWHTHFTTNVALRPALTLTGQLDLAASQKGAVGLSQALLAQPLPDIVAASPTSFVNVSADERASLLASTRQLNLLAADRLKVEGAAGGVLNVAAGATQSVNLAAPLKLPAVSLPAVPQGIVPAEPSELIKGAPNVVPNVPNVVPDLPLPRLPF